MGATETLWTTGVAVSNNNKNEHDVGMVTPRQPKGLKRRPWSAVKAEQNGSSSCRGGKPGQRGQLGSCVQDWLRDVTESPVCHENAWRRAPKQRVSGTRPLCHDAASLLKYLLGRGDDGRKTPLAAKHHHPLNRLNKYKYGTIDTSTSTSVQVTYSQVQHFSAVTSDIHA